MGGADFQYADKMIWLPPKRVDGRRFDKALMLPAVPGPASGARCQYTAAGS